MVKRNPFWRGRRIRQAFGGITSYSYRVLFWPIKTVENLRRLYWNNAIYNRLAPKGKVDISSANTENDTTNFDLSKQFQISAKPS